MSVRGCRITIVVEQFPAHDEQRDRNQKMKQLQASDLKRFLHASCFHLPSSSALSQIRAFPGMAGPRSYGPLCILPQHAHLFTLDGPLVYFFGGVIGRDHLHERLPHRAVAPGGQGFAQMSQLERELTLGQRLIPFDKDHLVVGGIQLFRLDQELLVELLAGTEADLDDIDILIGLQAAQADHALRQIQDPDRLAHIQSVQVAVLRHGSAGHDQLGGLRDRHEVADDALVCDGDGAAVGDLALEQRDDGAVAPQHVAEAGGAEAGHPAAAALDQHLAHALGGAHDVGGVDRLVRADQDEALDAVLLAQLHQVESAEHVVADGFAHVALHERHVLVGRRVQHDIRRVVPEDLLDPGPVADIRDLDPEVQRVPVADPELLLDIVGAVLVDIQDDQPLRLAAGDLAGQLRADGAAAAGDHDLLAPVPGHGLLAQELADGTVQQVLDGKIVDLAAAAVVGAEHRKIVGLDVEAHALVEIIELVAALLGHVRKGEHHALHLVLPQPAVQISLSGEHRHAVDLPADLVPVDIHEADRFVDGLRVAGELIRQHGAYAAGAHYGDLDAAVQPGLVREPHPGEHMKQLLRRTGQPGPAGARQIDPLIDLPGKDAAQEVQGEDRDRPDEGDGLGKQLSQEYIQDPGQRVHHEQLDVFLRSRVAPYLLVDPPDEPEARDARQGNRHVDDHPQGHEMIYRAGIYDQNKHRTEQEDRRIVQVQHPSYLPFHCALVCSFALKFSP